MHIIRQYRYIEGDVADGLVIFYQLTSNGPFVTLRNNTGVIPPASGDLSDSAAGKIDYANTTLHTQKAIDITLIMDK